jgi:hypothetical protein
VTAALREVVAQHEIFAVVLEALRDAVPAAVEQPGGRGPTSAGSPIGSSTCSACSSMG